jgi:hypothetical protein
MQKAVARPVAMRKRKQSPQHTILPENAGSATLPENAGSEQPPKPSLGSFFPKPHHKCFRHLRGNTFKVWLVLFFNAQRRKHLVPPNPERLESCWTLYAETTIAKIGNAAKLEQRAVYDALSELVDFGLLRRQARRSKDGKTVAGLSYWLLMPHKELPSAAQHRLKQAIINQEIRAQEKKRHLEEDGVKFDGGEADRKRDLLASVFGCGEQQYRVWDTDRRGAIGDFDTLDLAVNSAVALQNWVVGIAGEVDGQSFGVEFGNPPRTAFPSSTPVRVWNTATNQFAIATDTPLQSAILTVIPAFANWLAVVAGKTAETVFGLPDVPNTARAQKQQPQQCDSSDADEFADLETFELDSAEVMGVQEQEPSPPTTDSTTGKRQPTCANDEAVKRCAREPKRTLELAQYIVQILSSVTGLKIDAIASKAIKARYTTGRNAVQDTHDALRVLIAAQLVAKDDTEKRYYATGTTISGSELQQRVEAVLASAEDVT